MNDPTESGSITLTVTVMEQTRKTNWSNEELLHLLEWNNHKVEKIGDYYYWLTNVYSTFNRRVQGSYRTSDPLWSIQIDKDFQSENKAKHYIAYNIHSWTKNYLLD